MSSEYCDLDYYEYVWDIKFLLLLFEELRESLEALYLYLVSCEMCCTTVSAKIVIVNYRGCKCLFISEISSGNKSSVI